MRSYDSDDITALIQMCRTQFIRATSPKLMSIFLSFPQRIGVTFQQQLRIPFPTHSPGNNTASLTYAYTSKNPTLRTSAGQMSTR